MFAPGFVIQVDRFDVREQLQQGERPSILLKRDLGDSSQRVQLMHAQSSAADAWYILHEQLPGTPGQPKWSINNSSSHVVIPLFSYLLPDPSPEGLVHFGAQTGALAVALLPAELFASKILLAIGNVFARPDGRQGHQVWAGFAACVQKHGG